MRRCVRAVVTDDGSRVVLVLDDDTEVTIWRMDDLARPDLFVVDVLARLQLVARRLGWSIRLRDPCGELRALLDLAGLTEVVGHVASLRFETGGETESGEELGVQEVVKPGDPPV